MFHTPAPKAFRTGILSRSRGSGVLIYGPPGTGKTMLIKALAKEADMRMVSVSYGDLQSKYYEEAESKIRKLFAYARRHHPCAIFIDEADGCLRSRTAMNAQRGDITFLNQFLSEIDGISARPNRMPIVMAATNHPANIDEGILRRLSRRILVGLPDVKGREAILKLHLADEKLEVEGEDADALIMDLARSTHDYTGCDLRDLVERAALQAIQDVYKKEEAAERPRLGGENRVITREHLWAAKSTMRPSPKTDLAKIDEFHGKHGTVGR
ncbi:cell division cycle protein 48-like protein [Podospora fimiseda]|uniref:Cell division cycle protein 48-like protein n=1 Tax=Podospora fimiseda TaxID=252190 RepID=A0AAN7H1Q1_9PEZI|nr:cell division cycle protein 48-like protein [Podospora fimiseda]